jgi:hypothetical protein
VRQGPDITRLAGLALLAKPQTTAADGQITKGKNGVTAEHLPLETLPFLL